MARASSKPVLLRIGTSGGTASKGGNTPDWVFNAVNAEPLPASQKFFTWNDSGTYRTIPVFWDPAYLAEKKAMISALGAHFANNPAVKIVSASFANASSEDWAVPHTSTDVTNWLAAGYTSDKMLNAGSQIIDTTMTAFPYQYVTLAVGGDGHTGGVNLDPDENYVARNAVLAADASWPGRLIAQKDSLATFSPAAPGTNTLWQIMWDSAPDIGAQMLWYCYGDNTYRMNGGVAIDPSTALTQSVDKGLGYGVKYMEIYRTDIVNLTQATKYAHDALTAPTPTPTPSPTATPTPTPTPSPTATPTPTPSPTATPTPTPAATPTPTPSPTAAPTATPATATPTPVVTDLKITVTAGKRFVIAGRKNTYTIVATNLGPNNVSGAAVSDIFPAEFTGVTFSGTQSGGASGFTASGSGNIDESVTMPAGSSITYEATGKVLSSASGTLSDTASVTTPSGVIDSNPANNSATDTETIKSSNH